MSVAELEHRGPDFISSERTSLLAMAGGTAMLGGWALLVEVEVEVGLVTAPHSWTGEWTGGWTGGHAQG
jgi:hypothetical protein